MRHKRVRVRYWLILIGLLLVVGAAVEVGFGVASRSAHYERLENRAYQAALVQFLKEAVPNANLISQILSLSGYSDPFALEADADQAVVGAKNLESLFSYINQIPHSGSDYLLAKNTLQAMEVCAQKLKSTVDGSINGASSDVVLAQMQSTFGACHQYDLSFSRLSKALANNHFYAPNAFIKGVNQDVGSMTASLEGLVLSYPLRDLEVVTWSVKPPPLGTQNNATVIPQTTQIKVLVVVKNTGRVDIPNGILQISLTGQAGSSTKNVNLSVKPQDSRYLQVAFAVSPNSQYHVTIRCFSDPKSAPSQVIESDLLIA